MKILHVIPSVSPKRGGPSVAVRRMAESVAQQGIEVHIATTDDDGTERNRQVPFFEPVDENGVTMWYFPRQSHFYTVSLPLTRWLMAHVGDYDLVHIHALFSYPVGAAAVAAQRAKVPYIVRPLGTLNQWGIQNRRPWVKQGSLRLIEKPLLRKAARVHYTSRQEQQEAHALGINSPYAIIPVGLDIAPFRSLPDPATFREQYQLGDAPILLSLGRIDRKKGLDLLLNAFAEVHRHCPASRLVIAGDGDMTYLAELKAQANSAGIGDAVIWTGFVEGQTKGAALAAADLFVMPSHSENFGIAAVEALAAGLPTIVSTGVAIHHEITEAGAGVAVPVSAAPLAKAIRTLLVDAPRRAAMRSAALNLAQSLFSQEGMAKALIDLYQEIIREHKAKLTLSINAPSFMNTPPTPSLSLSLPLSVVILTHNEAHNLPECLASVQGWAGELFVVDSGSTDETIKIAETAGATVVSHPFENYAKQRNWAQDTLPFRHEWVLHLDADERVTAELQRSVRTFFQSGQHQEVAGAYFSRRTVFMGRWIKHGGHYPVYHTRLYRRDKGYCENLPYDQHFLVESPTVKLEGDLIDVLTSDLDTWSFRHIRWAGKESAYTLQRQQETAAQVAADLSGTPIEQRRWLKKQLFGRVPLLWRAFGYFFFRYVILLGFLDGKEGLIFHFLQGCWFRFYIDAKIYEQQRIKREE
jgi:glycosyltransferase involved in cell wall biosynthesis